MELEELRVEGLTRPTISRSQSSPIPLRNDFAKVDITEADACENCDVVDVSTLPGVTHTHLSHKRRSGSTIEDSSTRTRSSSLEASQGSSATSPSIYTLDSFTNFRPIDERGKSSTISRLKSLPKTGLSRQNVPRFNVQPSDFRIPPEQPEKRFVDDIGMIIPGVCDREQCADPRTHFVASFRLCEPIEYTTALADHGITYTDYVRLIAALFNFLEDTSKDARRRNRAKAEEDSGTETESSTRAKNSFFDTTEQLKGSKQHAVTLHKLLEDISWNFQARGVSVMVCVQSFSLFWPRRIAEAHIQVLHVRQEQARRETRVSGPVEKSGTRMGQRLSFINVFPLAKYEQTPRPRLERQSVSATTMTTKCMRGHDYHHQQSQIRDRSRPCALWPNAIPSHKWRIMNANVDRYGVDPYFRAWMRASINSRTRCTTYAKYMVEKEDDPFVNKRLEYANATLKKDLLEARGTRAWKERTPSTVNRTRYEHNRRLECRKTTENGSRLRIVRFGFRHPIYPPHTPEMDTLGLSKDAYQTIIADIDNFHSHVQLNTKCPGSYMVASVNTVRKMGTNDALMKVREYLRQLNASQRCIVWTIEKIPAVYDKGFGRNRTEWEISAWNAEDPLELLIQLEKWGIIESRLNLDDEE
ncbi:hypothetical protein A1F94_006018 [Pyrenophora tritici-repentis]|uniref:Uncharacterized protein n=2 Tax=Pyrenophora tritici-repentis TaxID=45151 RepID=A0A2W1D0E4_9PLEO|nr:hypothetical protein PtrM4_110570 [Pyrenophora tritici-repentis]KAG9384107.1 hypothetical protein A1F94_006018 [Pyrenophora tritici-repentis]KAI1514067.1 hypothetical protein Ptr86124_006697 [Pyrenophora tritici-repentis]KAI1666641.1 hypothetical protein L13192_08885 [Pyrenophora tritici-repentis]KAI1682468.1 hypothetical protein KJE20_07200 [Pyrenophora tritici-repentis]